MFYFRSVILGLIFFVVTWESCSGDGNPKKEATLVEEYFTSGDSLTLDISDRKQSIHNLNIIISQQDWDILHQDPEKEVTVTVILIFDGEVFNSVKLELHGGFARKVPKKSYRLTLPDGQYPKSQVFEASNENHKRFILQASWIDPTFMRNKLSFDLIRDLGGLSPRVSFANLSFNGKYHGFYTVIERVDKLFLERKGFDPTGNLYKAENHNANWAYKSNPLAGYDIEINEANPHEDIGELLYALTYTPTEEKAFEKEIIPRLNIDDFLIYQLFHTFAMNRDAFTKNYYLYHDVNASYGSEKARFRIISWDSDATFGIDWDGTVIATDEIKWHGSDSFSPRLFSIKAFLEIYLDLYEKALYGLLSPEAIITKIDYMACEIESYAQKDLDYWERGINFAKKVEELKSAVKNRNKVMKSVIEEVE